MRTTSHTSSTRLVGRRALRDVIGVPPVEAALATGRDGAVLISATGAIEYATLGALPMLGYEDQSVLHRSILDLLHPDDLLRIRNVFAVMLSEPRRTETGSFRFRQA